MVYSLVKIATNTQEQITPVFQKLGVEKGQSHSHLITLLDAEWVTNSPKIRVSFTPTAIKLLYLLEMM